MKQFQKLLAVLLCVGALTTGLAACGSDGDAEDNGAVHTEDTDQKDMNGATDGTADDGVLDEIGEDVKGEGRQRSGGPVGRLYTGDRETLWDWETIPAEFFAVRPAADGKILEHLQILVYNSS